ncbi:MAG: transporter [Candidatus Omnitrophica bacterium]|nr:transporter [Candidatus Omnitrophota bacterium]
MRTFFNWGSVYVWIIVLILALKGEVFAGRPLTTDDTETIETGHWEIEFGASYLKYVESSYEDGKFSKKVFRETTLEVSAKYGILNNWDAGITIPYIFADNPEEKNLDGFEDIQIQTKYRLFEEKNILPYYALGVTLKTQSANEDKGLGTGQVEVGVNNIFSKEIGNFTTHLNLGYNFLTKRKGQDDTFCYGLAWEYALLKEKLNLVGEIFGETNFKGDFDANPMSGLVGLNYALTKQLAFDIGSNFGISESAPDYEVIAGFTLSL